MFGSEITRRAFAATLAAAPLALRADDWVELFNGRSLDGWRASEHTDSWKVVDGALAAAGPRSHLFYTGKVNSANFKNFELEVELLTSPGCNSGVYFHTAFQKSGFPQKGFEVQVNNSAKGEPPYLERKRTGSLYGIRNIYTQVAKDDEWFKINVIVRGKNIQVRGGGKLLVDYTEPTPAVIPQGLEKGRVLDRGTFALQCHDPGSKVRYRSIRVRPLPEDAANPEAVAPVVDDTFRAILELGAANIPMVDYHVHLKSGLTLEQALAKSRRDGIQYGIAINCGRGFTVETDENVRKFHESMRGQPCFIAMQAEGREWTGMFSRQAAALFDYVFTDSMTWSDNRGRRMRTWIPAEVGQIADPQEFMDTLVQRAVGIFEKEPVDIYVNPTFLPDVIAKDYDKLWTEERMKKVVSALARNGVAMEINDRYKLPSPAFIRMAKESGVKFTFGTNNGGADDLGRCEYGIRMVKECGLKWNNFFFPGESGSKAVERKGSALKS